MINLKRIVEQQGAEGQYYDLGKDFANFRRTIDGADGQIKQRFEQTIGSKLIGKRIRARSSRGYKQYVKDYEFDVSKVTLDDYYDNYVVVAHDNTTPKAKEYFLKPGFKIQVIGAASGQPTQGNETPEKTETEPVQRPLSPQQNPDTAQAQPMIVAPAGATPSEQPVKENEGEPYEAYPIDSIAQDIKPWLPRLLRKPETAMRDFVKAVGWIKNNTTMFDLKVPIDALRFNLDSQALGTFLNKLDKSKGKFSVVSMELNDKKDEWTIRIRKIKI